VVAADHSVPGLIAALREHLWDARRTAERRERVS
jgi:hypothetical protein